MGRDGPILELERALRRPQAGILVHGLGGVGKTTLARGFVEWLARTEGLGMGHPLAMRVILSELRERQAADLCEALTNVETDDAVARLYATLGFAEESLDAKLRPLLVPLTFHERFVEGDLLEFMTQRVESSPTRAEIDGLPRAFVEVFAGLADHLAPREFHEQRIAVHLHGANFLGALVEAERLDMLAEASALLQALEVLPGRGCPLGRAPERPADFRLR